ncbi:MAG: hypothetical protein JXB17_02290, partial [Bacteroidales bacterium]|nr:hypothetical protein [Bacteroidales bacterium]
MKFINKYAKLVLSIVFISTINKSGLNAQFFANPSFEDEPKLHYPPIEWETCFDNNNTPDVYGGTGPSFSDVTLSATNGKTFVLMRVRKDSTYEDMQTKLLQPVKSGICYKLEIDLAYDEFVTWDLEPTKLCVYGGKEKCRKDQKLIESKPIVNTKWQRFVFDFIPDEDYEYLYFVPEWDGKNLYNGAIIMDNLILHEGWNNYYFVKLDTIVDIGSSFPLRPTQSGSYNWNPKTGLDCYDCKNPIATISDSITYSITISDNQQCGEYIEVFKIGYYCETDSFYMPIEMLDTLLNPDEVIALEPSISMRYLWYPKTGLSCSDCPLPRARVNKTTDYFATLLKPEGCYTIEKFTLRSICDTIPVKNKLDTTLAKNSVIFLHAGSSPEYLWQPAVNIDCYDCSKPQLFVQTPQIYFVSMLNDEGCIYKESFKIGVVDCDTLIKNQFYTALDTTIKPNSPLTLYPTGGQQFYWKPIPGLNCYDCQNPVV